MPTAPESKPTLESMPAQPAGKATVSLPAMTDRALLEDLRGVVKEGFRLTNANIEVVANDLSVVKDRVSILETERSKFSGGVRALSATDLAHEAQLAQERAAREALATKVESMAAETSKQTLMLKSITDLLEKPLVRRLGYAVAGLLLAGLTSATGYLARGNVQTPQPTIIQVAPVVTADGGASR